MSDSAVMGARGSAARAPATGLAGDSIPEQAAQYRYGMVLLLTLILVVFVVAAPSSDWARAVALGIESAALVVAVATARARQEVRRRRALILCVVLSCLILSVASGLMPREMTALINAIVLTAVPLVIVQGLVRLGRERGVTAQTVAGALAIYLSVGAVFAWIIGFVARVDSALYFAQNTDGTEGDRLYFSFATLTTTGFGDYSAATPIGHAIAVIEMLTGQIYLVTVIGLLVGNVASRRLPG